IVSDLEWAGSIPAADRLAVESLCVTLRQVGIDHRCPRAVERDATAHVEAGMSMHIHAVEDEIVRYLRQRVLCARTIAECHDAIASLCCINGGLKAAAGRNVEPAPG